MKIDLAGKVALVTASTAGIGFAIAKGLAESGAEVILNGRSEQSVNAAIARLQNEVPGAKARPAIADLSDADGAAQLLRAVTGVDILVNNAGIYGPQDFYATDDATWDNYWQTNVMSGVRLSRGLLPAMVSKGWGRVVFISSESARNIPADMIHYGVTKTAQLSLARGLAKYVAGSGVTVNSVLPGPTISDGFAEMLKDEVAKTGQSLGELAKAFVMTHRPSSVIQRAASVAEVANMVVYVCSPQASATSGAALRCASMAAWWMIFSESPLCRGAPSPAAFPGAKKRKMLKNSRKVAQSEQEHVFPELMIFVLSISCGVNVSVTKLAFLFRRGGRGRPRGTLPVGGYSGVWQRHPGGVAHRSGPGERAGRYRAGSSAAGAEICPLAL